MKWASLTAIIFALSAQATTLFTEDFTTSGGVQSGSGYSNVRTYTDNGVTVTVTAWSVTGNGDTTFQNSNVGEYSGLGLGVCNQKEGLNCSSPQHQVDNANGYDFVLFQFSAPIDPSTVTIVPYGPTDPGFRDATYYTGNAAFGLNLNGVTLAGLNALGLTNVQNSDSGSTAGRTINLVSGNVNSILFGAQVGSSDDYFKISDLTGSTVSSTPEPASFLLVGGAMIGLATLARRLKRS